MNILLKRLLIGGRSVKIEYHYHFDLPRNIMWKWLKDENVLRNSITGCKLFEEKSNGVYRGEIDLEFGNIKDVFILEIRRLQEKTPSYYQLLIIGKGKLGEIQGKVDLFLDETQGTTKLSINADVQVSGALAIASDRVINGEANGAIEKFLQRLEKEIKKGIYYSRKKSR